MKNKILIVIGLLLWLTVLLSFCLTPFTADLKVFMASANQANYISKNLIVGSYKVWELKSVFSRLLAYAIYKIAVVFVPFSSYPFEIGCKIVYAVLINLCALGTVKYIMIDKNKNIKLGCSIIVSAFFMAIHPLCQMQVEMTTALLVLMSFSLYYNAIVTQKRGTIKLFISGILIGATFYFKSVLILLSVSVVAAICICNIKARRKLSIRRMMVVVAGSLFLIVLNAGLILWINPSEFQEMIYASVYQSTLFSTKVEAISIINKFLKSAFSGIQYIPILIVGVIVFVCNSISNIRKKQLKLIFWHIIMWLMPSLFIILSNVYFPYHFAAYLFPCLIELYVFFICEKNKISNTICFSVFLCALILYLRNYSLASQYVRTCILYDKQSYDDNEQFLKSINFDFNEKVLFLDDGLGAYYLKSESYLKYYFPLPLQRLGNDSDLKCHMETMEAALSYDGRYISVYDKWFFNNEKNAEIKDKLQEEYKYIGEYKKFACPTSSNVDFQIFDLYERLID